MSRPDAKKNITTLVNAFGKNTMLRELANLVLIMVRCRRAALLLRVPCAIVLENTALSYDARGMYLLNCLPPPCYSRSIPTRAQNAMNLAYAQWPWLNSLLPVMQGNRDNIDSMAGGSQKVLTQVLPVSNASPVPVVVALSMTGSLLCLHADILIGLCNFVSQLSAAMRMVQDFRAAHSAMP